MEAVKYDKYDIVKFDLTYKDKKYEIEGYVAIIDRYGTFEQNEEPSYDIFAFESPLGPCLFKHCRQSGVIFIRKPDEKELKKIKENRL